MNFRDYFTEAEFRFEGDSVGIITAHNPQGRKLPLRKNKELNKRLWTDLRADGHDPWSIKGRYNGHDEDSFLVPDIGRADIVRYAKEYDQAAVIWAKKADKGYDVEWIENGKTTKTDKIANIRSLIAQSVTF